MPFMDQFTAAIISAGVVAAVVSGFFSWLLQSQRNRREDELRFIDTKRERYVALLVAMDRYASAFERWAYKETYPEDRNPDLLEVTRPDFGRIHELLVETSLLDAAVGTVGEACESALAMLGAAREFAGANLHSDVSKRLHTWRVAERIAFVDAARRDLGTG